MNESLVSFVLHTTVVRYVSVAGATILLYDYFLTIIDEVCLVWRSNWTLGKALYLATRYLCFADIAVIFIYLFYPQLNINSCKSVYNASAYLIVAGILIAECIMSMRTYALWGRSRRLLVSLLIMLIAGITVIIVVYSRKTNGISWIPSPVPQLIACKAQDAEEVKAAVAFGLLMAYECVILILTMWIGVKQWSEGMHQSPLIMQFYGDGVLYFFIMFAVSAANFTVRLRRVTDGDFYNLLSVMQRVFHSILSARMMLNLRQLANREPEEQMEQLTAPEFAASRPSSIVSGQETTTIGDYEQGHR